MSFRETRWPAILCGCTGRRGFVAIFSHFSGFEYFLLPNIVHARRILRSIIERTVINPLVDFEILQTGYEPHKTLGADFPQLSTFQITPFGKGLLEAINGAMKPDQP
jgi:hypothetical protein